MLVLSQQPLDSGAEGRVAVADLIQESGPVPRVGSLQRFGKEGLFVHVLNSCGVVPGPIDQCDVRSESAHRF